MPRPKTCRSRKRKASKHTPEVFVLSPQLLHKLGINIANIQTPTPASSSISVSAQDDLFKKPKSTRKSKIEESSVMTTATLMKESVLLSPSFINPVEYQESIENIPVTSPNVDSPAIDHVGNVPECSNISLKNGHLMLNSDNSALAELAVAKADPNNILKENDISGKLVSPQPIIPSKMNTSYNLDQHCSDLQYHIQTYITETEHFNLQKDLHLCNKKKIAVQDEDKLLITLNDLNIDDDHLDEAYSSDCSNGNNTISAVSAEFNLEPAKVENVPGQKINILSEEVVDKSRLNEMISKSLSPSIKDKMIPVSVDTVMSFNRNVTKADNSLEPTKYKYESSSQDQFLAANISMEQVSTADESFLDNIITGVMKIDEIDINILDVSDADLNTHNLSNCVYMNVPEASECNKLDIISDIATGAHKKNHTKLNLDSPTNNLQCDNNVQIANVQNITKVMFNKSNQVDSNPDILIEFIDKYPEVTKSSLNTINRNEYDCAIFSEIEADIKTIHDDIISKPYASLGDSINLNHQNEISTIRNDDVISADNHIKDNIVIEKEQKHKQDIVINDATESGVFVNVKVLNTPTESKIEMETDTICNCKCYMKNNKATHVGESDATNGKNEKLNEIASYLKMFVENKQKKSASIYSKSRPPNFSSEAVAKPKSCVHGVEKPGGSNEHAMQYDDDFKLKREAKQVPRTYKRNKNKSKPTKGIAAISNPIITHDKDINISDCIIPEKATDCFCLCSDYGTFDFYDFESKSYSHIHYWDNMSVDFNIIEWFSEFNYIDYVEKNLSKGRLLAEISESRENILDPICWEGWDYCNKTIAKHLFIGNVAEDSIHMPNITILDLPDNTLETTKRNDSNDMRMENSMSQTKTVIQDNKFETNSINPQTSQFEAADDPNNEFEVIYQVIECSDELQTDQAVSFDSKITEDKISNLHSEGDVPVKENKKGDIHSVGKFSITSKSPTKIKPSNDINENSTQLEAIHTDTVSKKKSCSDVSTKINVDEENTRRMDKKEYVEVNLVSNMKNLGSYEKWHDSELGLQEQGPKKSSRKRSSNIDKELLNDMEEVSKRSKRQASDDIKPEFTSEISTKLEKGFCTKEHDLKNNKSANKRHSRNAKKHIEPEVDAEDLNNSLKDVEKVTNIFYSNVKTDESTTKPEVNPETFNSLNEIDKTANSDVIHYQRINESTTKKKSRNASKDIKPEINAEAMNILNKAEKRTSPKAVYDRKSIESTRKRQSRSARKDINEQGGNAEESSCFGEKNKIASTDAENEPRTKESSTKRQSCNARKDTNQEIHAEEKNSSNKTEKITNSEAVSDLSTIESTTKKQSCNARNHTKEPEGNAEESSCLDEKDKMANTVVVNEVRAKESSMRRQSRNAKKGAYQEIHTEEKYSTNKTDKIPSSKAVSDLKTHSKTERQSCYLRKDTIEPGENAEESSCFGEKVKLTSTDAVNEPRIKESTTRRQFRYARKNIKAEMVAEESNKVKKTDKVTTKEAVHDPKLNESTDSRRSSNDRKYINYVDAEEMNRINKPDNITGNEAVRDLKPNVITTRRQSRNVIKYLMPTEELNSFKKKDNKTINDIQPLEITRRRSCRISSEKLNTKLSEIKSQKTESPPPKLRSKRSKTSEDPRSLKSNETQQTLQQSQKSPEVKKAVKTYESKKEREKKANNSVTLDVTLDATTFSSDSKARASDAIVASNTNISTISKENLGRDDQKQAIKRKRSAVKSIDSDSTNAEETHPNSASQLDITIMPSTSDIAVRITHTTECGVCDAQVEEWIDHIAAKHNYLAWKKGDPVLDFNNPNAVKSHLKSILSTTKKLTCSRCACKLKNPKSFLEHIKNCDKSDDEDTALSMLRSKKAKRGEILGDTKTCGMCSLMVGVNEWESHVMFTHYNLAWAVGDTPTNLKDPNLIYRLLKVYKSAGGQFKCNLCGLTRSSALGFYAHVVGCGKSDEEMEEHKETCDQCHKSYLCVNRQPHMAWHTQMQIRNQAKIKKVTEEASIVENVEEEPEVGGRKRKAARKAISMIQKLKTSKDDSLTCERCDYTGTTREQLKSHKCVDAGTFIDHGDESEDSLEFASDQSDDEESDGEPSDGADAVSVNEDEQNNTRRKRKSEHVSKYERIPFVISSEAAAPYVENASKLFITQYFSDDTLFENWRNAEYTILNEEEIATYTPRVAESCKFATAHKWTTLNRFESVKLPVIALFVGGCPAGMCWVPSRLSTNDSERHYLALASHLGPDPPRYSSFKRYSSPGSVLQIWDFGHKPYASNPKLSMCIAMDKGTVWSMSWCPSGARDSASSKDARLLGLVAVACSDGAAYVYSVPHPTLVSDEKEPVFVKSKPVAELRLYYDQEKQICQPSKILWSMQKGHEVVAVGYSNGMIAFYDLCTESPLTRKSERDRDIFYPFFSQQAHWSCITGMSIFPVWGGGRGGGAVGGAVGGAWAVGSPTGGALCGAGAARHALAAATDTAFLPLWPSALLLNDDSCTNEIDFTGVVRKYTAATAAAGCLHCSKVAQFSSPLLKTMITHPVFKDMKKRPQVLIQMRRLKRDPKDETPDRGKEKGKSINLEPYTYEKAIEEYGVRLQFCKKTDRLSYDKEFNPGRFPLSEVTAMAFCPTPTNHQWLAVATHSGLVFFIKTS